LETDRTDCWGRPDMSGYIFTNAILEGRPITLFNNGAMKRDFTYIDEVVPGVLAALDRPPQPDETGAPHRLYNLGNHRCERCGASWR
jgi:UDP-glucuronate 4-epimerase